MVDIERFADLLKREVFTRIRTVVGRHLDPPETYSPRSPKLPEKSRDQLLQILASGVYSQDEQTRLRQAGCQLRVIEILASPRISPLDRYYPLSAAEELNAGLFGQLDDEVELRYFRLPDQSTFNRLEEIKNPSYEASLRISTPIKAGYSKATNMLQVLAKCQTLGDVRRMDEAKLRGIYVFGKDAVLYIQTAFRHLPTQSP